MDWPGRCRSRKVRSSADRGRSGAAPASVGSKQRRGRRLGGDCGRHRYRRLGRMGSVRTRADDQPRRAHRSVDPGARRSSRVRSAACRTVRRSRTISSRTTPAASCRSTPPTTSRRLRSYGLSLCEWAQRTGYHWFGDECRIDPTGRPIDPGDYLPRRLMGEYLAWFYETALRELPPNLEFIRHNAGALDILADARDRERMLLDNGESIVVNHVILTSGHTPNRAPEPKPASPRFREPYPVTALAASPGAGRADHRRRHGARRLRRDGRTLDRPRWSIRRPRVADDLRAERARAEHHLLLALGRALLREVGERHRSDRRVPARRVHARGVRRDSGRQRQPGRRGGRPTCARICCRCCWPRCRRATTSSRPRNAEGAAAAEDDSHAPAGRLDRWLLRRGDRAGWP